MLFGLLFAAATLGAKPDIILELVGDAKAPIANAIILAAPNRDFRQDQLAHVDPRGDGTYELHGVATFQAVHLHITLNREDQLIYRRTIRRLAGKRWPPPRQRFKLGRPPRTAFRSPARPADPGHVYELLHIDNRLNSAQTMNVWTPQYKQVLIARELATIPSVPARTYVTIYAYPVARSYYETAYECCYCPCVCP